MQLPQMFPGWQWIEIQIGRRPAEYQEGVFLSLEYGERKTEFKTSFGDVVFVHTGRNESLLTVSVVTADDVARANFAGLQTFDDTTARAFLDGLMAQFDVKVTHTLLAGDALGPHTYQVDAEGSVSQEMLDTAAAWMEDCVYTRRNLAT